MRLNNLLLILLLLVSFSAHALPKAKITLIVVDEMGDPIEGAKAGVGFTMPLKTGWGSRATGTSGLTDSNGLYTAEGETEPYIGIGAEKEGYYRTQDIFSDFKEVKGFIGMRKWQPWNPTVELMLKKIKNPIPLYAIKIGNFEKPYEMPELNKFIGFDLVAKDWVIPYGLGTKSDFLFKLEIHQVKSDTEFDAVLTLKFTNPDDGIQLVLDDPKNGSQLRLPHNTPTSGYQTELVQKYKRDNKKMYHYPFSDDQNYFFRVRTEKDDKGNITSAHYGKIHGSIQFSGIGYRGIKTSQINFTYYLNPTSNDTNLEFDPKRNLFKGLSQWEEVKEP